MSGSLLFVVIAHGKVEMRISNSPFPMSIDVKKSVQVIIVSGGFDETVHRMISPVSGFISLQRIRFSSEHWQLDIQFDIPANATSTRGFGMARSVGRWLPQAETFIKCRVPTIKREAQRSQYEALKYVVCLVVLRCHSDLHYCLLSRIANNSKIS